VEPGNDPGRDEYGLPPVDIEVPDDARDLDRDVQAYYRELRARRRHLRIRRLTGPLTRHGMILPLIAACLALTLLTGSLLTVLSGRQVPVLRHRTSPGPTHGVPASAQQLPNAMVRVGSEEVELSSLAPAVLAWVPAGCASCGPVLRRLASQTANARVPIYFFGDGQAPQDLTALMSQAGPRYRQHVVDDTNNVIGSTYQPMGVTAILAHSDGSVASPDVVRELSSASRLKTFESRLALLASPGAPAASSSPSQQPVPRAS
jgi:hypothetical protein